MNLINFILIPVGFLIGSMPTGFLMGKMLKGIDIREHGSGNPGATNVFRVVGKTAGIMTLVIDALKGYLPVMIFLHFSPGNPGGAALIGFSTIAGHDWSLFLNFKGGKGVATSTGVALALLPWPTLIAFAVFVVVFSFTRIVSIGSILGALTLSACAWILNPSALLRGFAAACTVMIIILHKKNIERLIKGEEHKISFSNKHG